MLENSYGTVSVDGKKLWLRQDAYAVGTLDNSYYEAFAVDALGCDFKVSWETTQIWNISKELGRLHFELSQTRDASEQTVLRQNIRALDAVAEHYGGAVDIEDESNACDWDRYSVTQLDFPVNLVLTSLSQDTSITSDVARKQAQNARGVNEQMRRKPEYPCRSDER